MKKSFISLISISTLMLNLMIFPAFAENSDPADADRYHELQRAEAFDTEKIKVNRATHSFEQTVVYTTFNKDRDPKEILQGVCIDDIPYIVKRTETPTLISEEKVTPLKKSIITEAFIGDEEDVNNKPMDEISESGIIYKLSSKTLKEGALKERKEHKITEITYTAVEDNVSIPSEKSVTIKDMASGKDVEGQLSLDSEKILNEYWDSDFEFPITVSGYGADAFMLNDKEIPGNANLIDYKDDFLDLLNLNKDYYKISSIEWEGEPYDVNGDTLRNAVAKGSKYVKDIKAVYDGDVSLPAMTEKTWHCTYTEVFPEGDTLYTMATKATYTLDTSVYKDRGGLAGTIDKVIGKITAAYSTVIDTLKERPVVSIIPVFLIAGFTAFFITRKNREKRMLLSKHNGNI